MSRRLSLLALACAALAFPAASQASPVRAETGARAAAPACTSVSYGGRGYVLYRQRVKCAFARRWVKRLHRTKQGPSGWDCRSGSGFRTGGRCERGSRLFGWHPGD